MGRIWEYYLIMTRSCNMHCIYCIQGQNKPQIYMNIDHERVASYFPLDGEYRVVFYGGEPLLQFDDVIKIATLLKKRNPKVKFAITTNGTMLTFDKVKIFNELDFHVSVSHDGPKHSELRGIQDFLKVNPEPFLALKGKSLIATATRLNWNFYDIWNYFDGFEEEHGLPHIKVRIQTIKDVDNGTTEDLFIYQMPEFETMLDNVFLNLKNSIIHKDFTSREYIEYQTRIENLNYILHFPDEFGAYCGAEKSLCSIDIEGNLYPCCNSHKSNGNISVDGLRSGNYNPFKLTSECRQCSIYLLCGGGCVVTAPEKRKYMCYLEYQQGIRLLKVLNDIKEVDIYAK
jgi:radical SAM protein with 4Fe4S-binding SPASM domain